MTRFGYEKRFLTVMDKISFMCLFITVRNRFFIAFLLLAPLFSGLSVMQKSLHFTHELLA